MKNFSAASRALGGVFRTALPCAALLFSLASPVNAAERQPLSRHLPAPVANLQPVDRLDASARLDLVISLPLRNQPALTNLLRQMYDPASPSYHQYLTPDQFASMFGPTAADYEAVQAYARAQGFTVTGTHPNRTLLDVSGAVKDIETAFRVNLRVYPHPEEARTFFAPDAEPSLDLTVPVLSVHGLDSYLVPKPLLKRQPLPGNPTNAPYLGSGPGGTYMGNDFRAAYAPGTALTGAGQTVGLFELDGFFPGDITQYKAQAGLPNVPVTPILLDGFNGAPGGANVEVALDIEVAIAMAPGLSQVLVYEGFNPLDILNRMATDNLAKQLSSSWGWLPFDLAINQIFQQFGAQGQSMYQASGDNCAWVNGVMPPSDDPYVTVVGGTTLTTAGPGGAWASEKVWNWGGGIGSGGGISTAYSIPVWQQGIDMSLNQGSTVFRNIPDVALTADNIFIVADNGLQEIVGGTSAAAPLWAGFTALINQQALQSGRATMGFINPALYAIGKGAAYAADFHDIVAGDNTNSMSSNLFFSAPGYDLCTGWGTPNGTNLIDTLIPPVAAPFYQLVTNTVLGGNGNGLIDSDECDSLSIVIKNIGSLDATTVRATLSTTTPGVAIAQATAAYPNLPVGASGTNAVPFKVSTTPTFICGTTIQFTLIIKSDQSTAALQFTVTTGVPGAPLRFDNSTPAFIPDLGETNSSILVTNLPFAVNKLTVSMFITHTFDSDLLIQLISPDGITNVLVDRQGFAGQNFGLACSPDSFRTTLDDAAATPISAGLAPFLGSFQPQQPLSIFIGRSGTNINGVWRLRAVDEAAIDSGTIQCWSLIITPTVCTDGGGECPGSDLALGMIAQPDPVVQGNNLTYTMSVTNNGPSTAKSVSISQVLPPPNNATFVSCAPSQGGYSQAGGVLTANLGKISPGGIATVRVIVAPTNPPSGGLIGSTATASSEQFDPDLSNNSANTSTHVTAPTADLGASISATPNPTVVGGPLTYTVTVVNNGPVPATGVTVTNFLPVNVALLSASSSQGSLTTVSNLVIGSVGPLAVGAHATLTVGVTPTAQGTLVASVGVGGNQIDPLTGNNTASVSTVVGPSADLALTFFSSPSPVITQSNLTYTILVTNLGPTTASGVVVNGTLPTGVELLSSTSSGTPVNFDNQTQNFSAGLGDLLNGAWGMVTLTISTPATGGSNVFLSATAAVSGNEGDPVSTNNSATVVTLVAPPFVSVIPAGATLTQESGPVNGALDNGETVTVDLRLRNVGNVNSGNLVATLLSTNGVSRSPTNYIRTYGMLPAGGLPVASNFTFTVSGPNGGVVTAVLQLQDGTNNLGTASFSFTLPTTFTFANTNGITIPTIGAAAPYPSTLVVAGLSGTAGNITATLSNLSHGFPQDIDVLLVGPAGQDTILMSGAGAGYLAGADVTFDDYAAAPVPNGNGPILSTSYRPADYLPNQNLLAPAPAGPYPAAMSVFNGANPNGTWSLYVDDHTDGDDGNIAGGWSLAITFISPVNQSADLAVTGVVSPTNPITAGGNLTYTFTVTNKGPNTASLVVFTNPLPAGVTLVTNTSSQGNLAGTANGVGGFLGALDPGAAATVTIVVQTAAAAAGSLSSTATVSVASGETDLNPANNTTTVTATVNLPVADLAVSQIASVPGQLPTGSNLTFSVTVTNRGPGAALSTMLTNRLGAALTTVNLGTLAAGASTNRNFSITPFVPGVLTNIASVSTASTDPVSTNNSTTASVQVVPAAPQLVAGAVALVSESGPVNGAVDPGETVVVSLTLTNVGSASTSAGFAATLLAAGGVSAPSGNGNYGALTPGQRAARMFQFTALSLNGGTVTASLHLQDGATDLGTVAFVFHLSMSSTFANTAAITIPNQGAASPYPSAVTVSNLNGVVSKATVSLNGFTHSFPSDVNVLLVSPAGTNVLLMSHAGSGYAVTNLTLGFDDAAAAALPFSTVLFTGTAHPTAYDKAAFPAPAPAAGYVTNFAALKSSAPNGLWWLYVADDSVGNNGVINNGWSLNLTTVTPLNSLLNLTPPHLSGVAANNQFQLTVSGQPGQAYQVQVSANLTSWTSMVTNTASLADGTFQFSDPAPASVSHRFYRALLVTP